jgi:hypothetical protein
LKSNQFPGFCHRHLFGEPKTISFKIGQVNEKSGRAAKYL